MSKCFKRFFAVLVTFTLTLSLFPSLRVNAADEVASGKCGTNLTWSLNSEGTLTISGTGEMFNYDSSNNMAPWLEDYRNSIVGVTIEKGVTSIGDLAFPLCSILSSVLISDSVTSIGEKTFYLCTSLESIEIPNSVTSIGKNTFNSCTSLESIEIPNSVTSIDDNAFNKCTNLKTITIPDSVTSIGTQAFYNCTSLESIEIPNSVTSIGKNTFDSCTSLESIEIPNSVTSIGTQAFYNCTSLESIEIPNSVTSIGIQAFYNCTSLESIEIPNGITQILGCTFSRCTSLKNITIPNSVTSIGENTFDSCTSLESIEIPNGITQIISASFSGCTSLKTVTIPDSVTSIGSSAFFGCTSLESISVPDNVTSIGAFAFQDCTNLKSVVLSRDCSMGIYPFLGCGSDLMTYYYYDATYTTDGNGKVTGKARSYFGDELTITPKSYYEVDQIKYKDANGKEGIISPVDGKYYMPDSDSALEVTVYFKHITADVRFLSEDGKTELQSSTYNAGSIPSYEGAEPEKEADAQYTYSFAGWTDGTNTYGSDKDLPPVTDNVDYKAVFESTTNKYTIEFVDENGNVLQSESLEYGTTPSFKGTTPVKSEDDKYTYEFSGWSSEISSVTGDATYKAVFTSTEKSEPTNTPIKKDDTPTPVNTPGTYYLKSMVEQDGNIIFTIKQSEDDTKTYDLLSTVSSDGTKLTEGDQYTSEKGSAIITVKKSYLDTLTAGNHKLTVTFTDGGTITITYEVKAPAQENKPAETKAAAVSTGEVIAMTTVAGSVMLIVSCGIVVTVLLRRRKENG